MRLKLFENFDQISTKEDVKEILQDIIDDYDCEVIFTDANSFGNLYAVGLEHIFRYKPINDTPRYLRIDSIFNNDNEGNSGLDNFRLETIERLKDYNFKVFKDEKNYDVFEYGSSIERFGKLANKISSYIVIELKN